MISALLLAAAIGQAPAPAPAPSALSPTPTPAPRATPTPRAVAPPRPAARPDPKAADREATRRMIAKRKSKKASAYARQQDREALEAQRLMAAQAQARKEFKEALPCMLENQRQMLQRQTAIERNAELHRAVSAMERAAGYVYPGQSPTVGPYR